jgi:hypothetical protein
MVGMNVGLEVPLNGGAELGANAGSARRHRRCPCARLGS